MWKAMKAKKAKKLELFMAHICSEKQWFWRVSMSSLLVQQCKSYLSYVRGYFYTGADDVFVLYILLT